MPSPFLFLSEVSEYTRAPLSTVRHWIATGRLPSVRLGKHRLVRREDLDAFIESAARRVPLREYETKRSG